MSDATNPETCACGLIAKRVWCAPLISGTKIFEAEFYHSLGKVIHNKRELNNELSRRDLVPIGNDYGTGEKMQQEFDRNREEARERSWDKAMENIQL